ncbi:hypothetical protein Btru_017192 [Bulinus truncatus]|nr:hypothetical protein Btru_017192 [Bulinus truncatus]
MSSSPGDNVTHETNTTDMHPVHATTTTSATDKEKEEENSWKHSHSHDIASSSRHDSPSNAHHKNGGQHTSELTARYTRGESAYVGPGLVGNRFADSQPTKCDGLADVMKQTSAADGTGAKRPFLDMRSIWDVGQLIVTRKSPRKPITCYKDYIT